MTKKHEFFYQLLDSVSPNSVFLEIGSERGEGSTKYLSNLAKYHNVDFFTVDIDNKINVDEILKKQWKTFYQNVRDESWESNAINIDALSNDKKSECIDLHGWNNIQQNTINQVQDLYCQDHVTFYHSSGSDWCKKYKTDIGRPISLLYLDNFDYIWDCENIPDDIMRQIIETNANIETHNQDCQIEHLTQLMCIEPFLDKNCIIGLDDTYQYNKCWIGKSGPGVVYLLSLGYNIVFRDYSTVFLKK
jgi:hypothetical protein